MIEFGRPDVTVVRVTGRLNLITKRSNSLTVQKKQVLHGLAYNCDVGSWVKEAALNEHVAATVKSLQLQKCAATNVCDNKNVQQQATKMSQ